MDRYIRYLIISFVLMFIMVLITVFNSHVSVGFLGWLAFLVSGTLLTGTGAFIGRLFLDFVRPDIYLTTGAVDAFYKRLFWSIGLSLSEALLVLWQHRVHVQCTRLRPVQWIRSKFGQI